MKKSTIILIVSLALVGLFLGEIQEVVGAWSWYPWRTTTSYSSCTNECASGQRICAGTTAYKVCGNFDSDSCYEWRTYYCPSGYTCSSGRCIMGSCTNECTSGSRKCATSTSYQVCGNYDPDLCYEWSPVSSAISCPPSYVCSNGICVVAPKCTDSDGGLNYNVKGTATDDFGTTWSDKCYGNYIGEGFCAYNETFKTEIVNTRMFQCSNCQDGACI